MGCVCLQVWAYIVPMSMHAQPVPSRHPRHRERDTHTHTQTQYSADMHDSSGHLLHSHSASMRARVCVAWRRLSRTSKLVMVGLLLLTLVALLLYVLPWKVHLSARTMPEFKWRLCRSFPGARECCGRPLCIHPFLLHYYGFFLSWRAGVHRGHSARQLTHVRCVWGVV